MWVGRDPLFRKVRTAHVELEHPCDEVEFRFYESYGGYWIQRSKVNFAGPGVYSAGIDRREFIVQLWLDGVPVDRLDVHRRRTRRR
jgi:hypothetical protein